MQNKPAFERNGYLSPIRIISTEQAASHRARMEAVEAQIGPLHYQAKVHTVMSSPYELATHPKVLNVVTELLGDDVLLYNVEYIVKEPQSASFVSWHQDLTYWGFNADDVVSMWLALSPATRLSGCMRMVPGSHLQGMIDHSTTNDANNVLFQGQTVSNVDESRAVLCDLLPGEATFHHGWTLHASSPNQSTDRRIGLNAQFIKPSMRQLKQVDDSALLISGQDQFGHFQADTAATVELAHDALERFAATNQKYQSIAASAN